MGRVRGVGDRLSGLERVPRIRGPVVEIDSVFRAVGIADHQVQIGIRIDVDQLQAGDGQEISRDRNRGRAAPRVVARAQGIAEVQQAPQRRADDQIEMALAVDVAHCDRGRFQSGIDVAGGAERVPGDALVEQVGIDAIGLTEVARDEIEVAVPVDVGQCQGAGVEGIGADLRAGERGAVVEV